MASSRLSGLHLLVVGVRLSILTAIFASAALVVEYTRAGDPAFCGVQSGCFTVQRWAATSLATPLPLPHVGLFAYLGLFVLSLTVTPKTSRTLAALAGAGAATAAVLLGLQAFVVKAYCVYCVAVDVSAIAAGVLAILLARALSGEGSGREAPDLSPVGLFSVAGGAWALASAAAVALPFYWAERPEAPPVPPEVLAWQEPGKLTIVTFTDFECPFCRKLSPILQDIKVREGDRVRYARKMVPLEFHRGAVPAALAYLCAPEEKRDAMAERLYAASPTELEIDRVHELGRAFGLDTEAFKACIASDAPREEIRRDRALFEAVGGRGLPLTYVGTTAVSGFQPDKLQQAAARASDPPRLALKVWWMIAAISTLGLLAAFVTLRTPLAPRQAPARPERGDEPEREEETAPAPRPKRKKAKRRRS